jgi:ABC-type multidrug transport system ATPase subunit
MHETGLVAQGLSKSFDGVIALHDVDLAAMAGTLTAVQGAANSGRTTLMRCLAGTYRPTDGAVVLRGAGAAIDLAGAEARAIAWARRHRLAVYDGGLDAPPRTTGMAAVVRRTGVPMEEVRAGFERLGLAELADVAVGRLRPDAARRVGLVAALVHPAAVVLLDDPLGALDAAAVAEWIDERRARGDAIVVTAPIGQEWNADAAGVLDEGTIHWLQP